MYRGDQNERIYENLILIMRPWSSLLTQFGDCSALLSHIFVIKDFPEISIGFRSGLCAGHSIFSLFLTSNNCLKFAMWQGIVLHENC